MRGHTTALNAVVWFDGGDVRVRVGSADDLDQPSAANVIHVPKPLKRAFTVENSRVTDLVLVVVLLQHGHSIARNPAA